MDGSSSSTFAKQRFRFFRHSLGEALLRILQPLGNGLRAVKFLLHLLLQLLRGRETRIELQSVLRFGLGFLNLALFQQRPAFFDMLLRLGPDQNAPQLGVDLFERSPGIGMRRIDLQSLPQKVARLRIITLRRRLPRLSDQIDHRLRLQCPADRIEIEKHVFHRLVSLRRQLPQQAVHDGFQRRRAIRRHFAQRFRLNLANSVHQTRGRFAGERSLVSHQLVKQHSERPKIRALVRMLALILLGRHVRESPDQHARLRLRAFQDPRDPEVHHLHNAFLADHDVGGLDIAMNDAALMREVKRPASLQRIDQLQRNRKVGAPRNQVFQTLSIDQFHGDEGNAALVSHVVHRYDVGVLQAAGGLRLAVKTLKQIGIVGDAGGDGLQRNEAVDNRVPRAVHHAHGAMAQLADHLVFAQLLQLTPLASEAFDAESPHCAFSGRSYWWRQRYTRMIERPNLRTLGEIDLIFKILNSGSLASSTTSAPDGVPGRSGRAHPLTTPETQPASFQMAPMGHRTRF